MGIKCTVQGQSTIEYILVVSAVLAIGVSLVLGQAIKDQNGKIISYTYSGYQNKINESYSSGTDAVATASQGLFSTMTNSQAASN
jgi:hypothetical protein